MIEYLPIFKTIHIIGFTSWFAGLFYLVRILIYQREASEKNGMEGSLLVKQFSDMANKVFRVICNPAMMITWTFGLLMLWAYGIDWIRINSWIHVKLFLLFLLLVYHFYCKRISKRMQAGIYSWESADLRFINEIPTLFLIGIVSIAVFRNTSNYLILFVIIASMASLFYYITHKK